MAHLSVTSRALTTPRVSLGSHIAIDMKHRFAALRRVADMWIRVRYGLLVGGVALLVAACAGPKFSPPPDAAGPDVVLRAYLQALVTGDCSAGQVLGTSTFGFGNGELCGHTTVSSFSINGAPATPNGSEVVFSTTLETSGTADGTVRPGGMTWFYDLKRQPTGVWRLAGGGSGP